METNSFSTIFCAPDIQDILPRLRSASNQWADTRILKRDHGTTVALLSLPQGAVVIKHHRLDTWRRRADALLYGSPARRAWTGAKLLQRCGFPVPRPLAVLERYEAGNVRESMYVSEGLTVQTPLNVYWPERQKYWTRQQRQTFLRALANFLHQFHAAGLYCGDLKDANLLVDERDNDRWVFYLVDLDRVTRYTRLSQQRRLKNLVQLDRTLGRSARVSERLLFLYRYLGEPLPRARRRVLLRRLLRLRSRKDREYAHRGVRHALITSSTASKGKREPALPILSAVTVERAPISCCIVCFNEEQNIRRCLESVKWCDEIVIIDSFSTDRTVDICRLYTDRVIQRSWPGYVKQKRFALAQATHEWVLNVDADEEVSPELQQDIIAVLHSDNPAVDGFFIPRLVYYVDRWWWRGWYPGYRLRLFRKAKVRWGGVDPHEKVLLRGQAERLHGNLYHYTYVDLSDHLRSLNSLTEAAAQALPGLGRRTRIIDLCIRPVWRFLRMYFVRGCCLEGVPGFFVSVTAGFYVFLKYAKLWENAARDQKSSTTNQSKKTGATAKAR